MGEAFKPKSEKQITNTTKVNIPKSPEYGNLNDCSGDKCIEIPSITEAKDAKDAYKSKLVKETKEKKEPLEAETKSQKSLKNNKINYKEAFISFGDTEKYDESFMQKVLKFQKEHGLEEDGVFGDKTLALFILKNKSKIDFSRLSINKDILEFQKAIEQNEVSPQQLEKVLGFYSKYISSINLTKIDFSTFKIDKLLQNNSSNTFIAALLYANFKNSSQGKDKKFDNIYKKEEKIIKESKEKTIKQTEKLLTDRGLSKEQIKEITSLGVDTTNPDGTPKTLTGKLGKTLDILKSNPLIMVGAFVGFLMFIFGNRNGFAKVGFFSILGLVGGKEMINTMKNLGNAWGLNLDIDSALSDENIKKAKNSIATATTSVTTFAKDIAKKAGVKLEEVEEKITGKNDSIKTAILAKYPKLKNKNNLEIITKRLSADKDFQKIKVDNLKDLKIENLSKETQEELEKNKITDDSEEFKAYKDILQEKITEAKAEGKEIETIGGYFTFDIKSSISDITGEQIGIGAGAGFMAWGLLTKEPIKFFLGAGIVAESIYSPIRDFFDNGEGIQYIEKAKEITGEYWNTIEMKLNTLSLNKEIKDNILKGLEKKNFSGLRKVYKNEPEIIKFISFAEENFYTAEVESKTGENGYIPSLLKSVYKSAKDYTTELTDGFEQREKNINGTINELINLKKDIEKTTISNKSKLINSLNREINRATNKIKQLENLKEKSKVENYKNLKLDIQELELKEKELKEEINKLKEKPDTDYDSKDKMYDKLDELELIEEDIASKKNKLSSASIIVTEIKKEKIEKPESIAKLKKSISNLKEINNSTDLLALVSVDGKLSSSNLEKVTTAIENIKNTKENYKGNNSDVLEVITEGEKTIKNLISKIDNISGEILNKITIENLENYPNTEIKNYKNILDRIEGTTTVSDFNKKLNTHKKIVFDSIIDNVNISEIQVLRKNFLSVSEAGEKIEKRIKYLAENKKAGEVDIIKKLIEDSDIIDESNDKKQQIEKLNETIEKTKGNKKLKIELKNKIITNLQKEISRLENSNINKYKEELKNTTIFTLYKKLKEVNSIEFNNKSQLLSIIEDLYNKSTFENENKPLKKEKKKIKKKNNNIVDKDEADYGSLIS